MSGGGFGIEMRIPAELAAIPYVRMVLRRTMPSGTADDEALYLGAVTEILANAIAAHQRDDIADPIEVGIELTGPDRGVHIHDSGSGFDPLDATARPVDGGSGLGLRIARSVCVDLRIESGADGTAVVLPFPSAWVKRDAHA